MPAGTATVVAAAYFELTEILFRKALKIALDRLRVFGHYLVQYGNDKDNYRDMAEEEI